MENGVSRSLHGFIQFCFYISGVTVPISELLNNDKNVYSTFYTNTLSEQRNTRPEPWYLSGFLRCPQSAYVRYASIVRLGNHSNIHGQGRRVGKKAISIPARRLIDVYWTYTEWKQRSRGWNWFLPTVCTFVHWGYIYWWKHYQYKE